MQTKETDSKFTSKLNEWKAKMSVAEGLPVREWKPLKVAPHPRQSEIDAFKALPSRFA